MSRGNYSKYAVDEEVPEKGSRLEIKDGTVPLVIRSLDPGLTLRELDSRRMSRTLTQVAGEELDRVFFTNKGCVTVYVTSSRAFTRLKAITSITGVSVKAELPRWFHRNACKIGPVPQKFNDKRLLELLSPSGVIHVRRQLVHSRRPDGSIRIDPTDLVVLHFGPEYKVPRQVKMGMRLYDVHSFLPPPVLCSRCQEFGHVAKTCPNGQRCKHCAGPHPYQICTKILETPRCANCDGAHTTTFAGCKAKLREVKRKRDQAIAEKRQRNNELRKLDEQREAEQADEFETSSRYSRYFFFD